MAAFFISRGLKNDTSTESSPATRPTRNPDAEPTAPPSAALEQPAATTRPFCDAAAAAAEDAYAETTQRLSKLNVDAVEVSSPARFQSAVPTVWNVGAAEFRPQAVRVHVGGSCEPQPGSYEFPTGYVDDAEDAYEGSETFCGDAEEMNEKEVTLRAYETLADLPCGYAKIDYLASSLIANVRPLVGASKRALQILANVIVSYAESSPDVSYTCAQLCAHLNRSGIGGSPDAFWHCLLLKCGNTSKKLQSAHDSAVLRMFTTFMVELLVANTIQLGISSRVVYETDLKGMKSASISMIVKRLLMALLGCGGGTREPQPSDDDVKCASQMLKLCGWELASIERDNPFLSSSATSLASTSAMSATSSASAMSSSGVPPPSVSDILKALCSRRDRACVLCQTLIDYVIMLEALGWGRSPSAADVAIPVPGGMQAAVAPNEQQYQQLQFQCDPDFYSHNGREIARREAGFANSIYGWSAAQDHTSRGFLLYTCSSSAVDYVGMELNDEVCGAFEAFCEENFTKCRKNLVAKRRRRKRVC